MNDEELISEFIKVNQDLDSGKFCIR